MMTVFSVLLLFCAWLFFYVLDDKLFSVGLQRQLHTNVLKKKTEFQLYVYLKKNNVWLSCLLYLLKSSCVHVYSMSNTICVKWEGWISSCVICIEYLANKLYWYVVKTRLINPFNPRLSKKKDTSLKIICYSCIRQRSY